MTLPADIDALVDKGEHERSFAPFAKAEENLKAMKQGVIDAQAALEEAKKGPAALAVRMASGEAVTAADRAAAQAAINAAQDNIDLYVAAVEAAQGIWQRAHDHLNGWSGRANQAAFDALIDRRIQAAAKCDAAAEVLATAQTEYGVLRAAMADTITLGVKIPSYFGMPAGVPMDAMSEAAERAMWRRPA